MRVLAGRRALFAAMFFVAVPVGAQNKPNIVCILLDKIGRGGFGVYSGTTPTPRSDRLAKEGMRSPPTTSRINHADTFGDHGRPLPIRSGAMRIPVQGK